MNFSTALMFGQTVSGIISAPGKIKGASKVAKTQKQTLEKYYSYNKAQIQKAYDNGFKNIMNNHISSRNNLIEQNNEVQSQINIKTSQQGMNISESSFKDDVNNQLDFEFKVGLQDMFKSQTNQIANLVAGMTTQQLQLENQYMGQLNTITDIEDSVNKKVQADMFGNILNLGVKGFEDYESFKSTNEESNFGSWLTSFNMPKALGGK